MSTSAGRYAYGPWRGGPDPLAPPIDLRAAVDELGRDVLAGSSPRSALNELLRKGTNDVAGLDELTRRVWQRKTQIQRQYRLDGTVRDAQRLLDEALHAERSALFRDPGDDARFRESQLDVLPTGTAAAVRELAEYPWRSEKGSEHYEEIKDLLGRELLDSRFNGMKAAVPDVAQVDVAQRERVNKMLEDLNALLAAYRQGFADIENRFAEFIRRHGDFFPEGPRDIDELIDSLAARSSSARRALNSMTPEQRAELAELSARAFGDSNLAEQLTTLDGQLRALRSNRAWDSSERFHGDDPLSMGEGARVMTDLAELGALAQQLGQAYPGALLEDIDIETLRRQLGEDSYVDARRLFELEKELRTQGIVRRGSDDALRLSPKALRRLGTVALADVVRSLRGSAGERDSASAGASGELTGSSRPWRFGDMQSWDVSRTVRNAVLRSASSRSSTVDLDVSDVEIAETEDRTRAAVVLCVDVSWSMVQEGRWIPMKRTALALHQLISTRFRRDALQLIAFGRTARAVELDELVGMEGTWEQGTNAHHALLLAGREIRRHPGARPVVFLITDGEPTAHLTSDGWTVFHYPPLGETNEKTLAEVDRLSGIGAAITVFRLGDDPRLAAFVDLFAARGSGRVVAPDLDGLGAAVVGDYLKNRG